MIGTILIVLLIFAIIGGAPGISGHSYGWGPSGFGAIILIVLLVLLFTGRL